MIRLLIRGNWIFLSQIFTIMHFQARMCGYNTLFTTSYPFTEFGSFEYLCTGTEVEIVNLITSLTHSKI